MSAVLPESSRSSLRAQQAARFVEVCSYGFIGAGLLIGAATAFDFDPRCRSDFDDCSFMEKYPSFWVGIGIAVAATFQGAVVVMISAYVQARLEEPIAQQLDSARSALANPAFAPAPTATPSPPPPASAQRDESWSYGHDNKGHQTRVKVSRSYLKIQTWDGKAYGNQRVKGMLAIRSVSQDPGSGALAIEMDDGSMEFVPNDPTSLDQTSSPLVRMAGS